MSDLIERQAAIDAARNWYEGLICGSFKGLDKRLRALPSVQPEPCEDAVSRSEIIRLILERGLYCDTQADRETSAEIIRQLPSAQPEQPPYVAEIEAEYQKAVKMPHIHKPLAKALYEVWKKHDREDAERRTDER